MVGLLIVLVDHYSFRAILFDPRYFFLYLINQYKLVYMSVVLRLTYIFHISPSELQLILYG